MKPFYPAILLTICLGAITTTTAQSKTALQPYLESRWVAKINLLSWLDPTMPTLQPGMEYRLNKRISLELTGGIPVRIYDNITNTDSTYNKYYKLKAELRFFPGERGSFYIAPELSFIRSDRTKYNGVFIRNGVLNEYDFAHLDKSVITFVPKFGFVAPFRRNHRWLLDVSGGIGARFANLDVSAVNTREGPRTWWRIGSRDREGSTTSVHATLGLKIGYILH